MTKERAAAFTDAVIAIIMTILVLELDRPETLTLEGFWALRHDYFAYALSFFWLGSMWINVTTEWEWIDHISNTVLWRLVVMLFSASLIPYATSIVADNFSSAVAQCFYGSIVIVVTITNISVASAVETADNQVSEKQRGRIRQRIRLLWITVAVNAPALLIAALIWPPAMMVAIVGSSIFFIPASSRLYREKE